MEKKAIGWRRLLTMLAIAGGLTLLAGLGVLDRELSASIASRLLR